MKNNLGETVGAVLVALVLVLVASALLLGIITIWGWIL